ncbi:MFS transporter [Phenylobacterium aquaticum]|uniref:MFS transporter n=1 Tax=Phenylobacterium aquaticum TaxID=1763816 RepID=UPI001F5DEABE|nr:MFS transporter [Phenylobacterium aquaticum]MCI3131250.1 MFS transporter [Phenylobacterium aquaticum]
MTPAARILVAARGLRAFGDGFIALLLPVYLTRLGFSPFQVGALTTATLLGSAVLTLGVGLVAHRIAPRRLLFAACVLMLATGLAFAGVRDFWPLMVVGFVGTLNPSGGDVSPFLPLEQALLAHAGPDDQRTRLFARYSLTGSLLGAAGALGLGAAAKLGGLVGADPLAVARALFVLYGLIGMAVFLLYRALPAIPVGEEPVREPLGPSRKRVLMLAGLFSLDSFGGGFLVQSLLALWLFRTWGLSLGAASAFFFWAGVLTAFSQLASSRLAARIGLINTMVFTHIPAQLCLIAVAFAPSLPIAITLLLVRSSLSAMDVPARTSYVMAIVTPPERAAAASVTNVPRSLASALSPSLAGALLTLSPFAWPLVIGGGLKIAYDLLLLVMFRTVKPPEEQRTS